MTRLLCLAVVLSVSTSCALRPVYRELVSLKSTDKEVKLQLVDGVKLTPLANVRIEVGELRNRLVVTSAADGTFSWPVDSRYADELVVVAMPPGVERFEIRPAPVAAPAPAPEATPASQPTTM